LCLFRILNLFSREFNLLVLGERERLASVCLSVSVFFCLHFSVSEKCFPLLHLLMFLSYSLFLFPCPMNYIEDYQRHHLLIFLLYLVSVVCFGISLRWSRKWLMHQQSQFSLCLSSPSLDLCLSLCSLLSVSPLSRMKKKVKEALKKRSSLNDNFRNLHGYSWDYVLVFKVYQKDERLNAQQKIYTFKKVLSSLADGGIESKVFYNAKVTFSSPLS
jgi:hypothetical protein